MENVISTKEGYSFFIDEHVGEKLKKNFVVFLTGKSMSGTDVSEELHVSRMAVSQSLKNSFKKIYHLLKKYNRHLDPFDIAVTMSQLFCVSFDCDSEVNKFFNLFPSEIKKEIKTYAKDKFRSCAKCEFKTMCELL